MSLSMRSGGCTGGSDLCQRNPHGFDDFGVAIGFCVAQGGQGSGIADLTQRQRRFLAQIADGVREQRGECINGMRSATAAKCAGGL